MPPSIGPAQLIAAAGGLLGSIAAQLPAVPDFVHDVIWDDDDSTSNGTVSSVDMADRFLDPTANDGDRGCPSPQGTIGSYGSLRLANAGRPECNAHHIIQDAAVRTLPGYDRKAAPAIVLLGPPNVPGTPHYMATQAQRAATVAGTYGDERQVAVAALAAAGMPEPVISSALSAADDYFMGQLGLTYSSPMRTPGDRWGYGR